MKDGFWIGVLKILGFSDQEMDKVLIEIEETFWLRAVKYCLDQASQGQGRDLLSILADKDKKHTWQVVADWVTVNKLNLDEVFAKGLVNEMQSVLQEEMEALVAGIDDSQRQRLEVLAKGAVKL